MGKERSGILHHLILRYKKIEIIVNGDHTALSAQNKDHSGKDDKSYDQQPKQISLYLFQELPSPFG